MVFFELCQNQFLFIERGVPHKITSIPNTDLRLDTGMV